MHLLQDEDVTIALARRLASCIESPCCLFLQGPLGAGKTTFARGFIQAKGHQGHVPSPSYSLVQLYESLDLPIVHVDLYRLSGRADFESLGLLEWVGEAIWLIEWPERGASDWLTADIICAFDMENEQRVLQVEGASGMGQKMLQGFQCCD